MKRLVHRYDLRTGFALCGDRHGSSRFTRNADKVTCEPCRDEGLARAEAAMLDGFERARSSDRASATKALRTAHGHLLTACIYAADTAHLLSMGGADALAIASAQAIHQTLLRQVDLQAALLEHLDPEAPSLTLVPDIEDAEQEATR